MRDLKISEAEQVFSFLMEELRQEKNLPGVEIRLVLFSSHAVFRQGEIWQE